MSSDVMFNCHYKGKFVTTEGTTLECDAQFLFTNLASALDVSMYGQRMWYKLPWENMSELKLLFDGSDNFQRMCTTSIWLKEIEIFMEAEDVDGEEDVNRDDAGHEDHGLVDVLIEDYGDHRAEDNGDHRLEDDGDPHRAEDEGDGQTFEENMRVAELVAEFEDDEDKYDYHDTPENSDDEQPPRQRYETYVQGSGELKLKQVFDCIPSFKKAIIEYVLNEKFNVKYSRWGSQTSEVRCKITADCPFRVYCKLVGKFMIKTLVDKHSCMPDRSSSMLTEAIIEDRYNLVVSFEICRKAKSRALKILQKEHDEQFSRLKDYQQQLIDTNPGSTVELGTITLEGGLEAFDRFYICFETLKRKWKAHCRPIFGIDGCFLKCDVKGQMLAAVGRDANNQFYPVAWAIVHVENKDNWLWFIEKLRNDLELADGKGFTLISDRQKGLILAVDHLLPKVEHRICARHIYGNLKSKFPGRARIKTLFWAVAESFNEAEYKKAIEAVQSYDIDVYKQMMDMNPKNCSRAYFTTTSCCENVHNNFSESYNNAIDKARAMPLVEMLETIRGQAMSRIDMRKTKSLKHMGKFSLKVAVINEEKKRLTHCILIPGANGQYEVKEKGMSHAVGLTTKTCKCRRWEITGIPCRHALKVITAKKLDPEDFVSYWYLTTTWQAIYSDSIKAVNSMHFWRQTGDVRIHPPTREVSQGPQKKQKRIKGKHESPKKKGKAIDYEKEKTKVSKDGRESRCSHCSDTGHNKKRCPKVGVDRWPEPKKKHQADTMNIASQEGPSQSQPSQNTFD